MSNTVGPRRSWARIARWRVAAVIATLAYCSLSATAADGPQDHGTTHACVLVLNSYHPGYPWSDNELAGIMSVFAQARPDIDVCVEHLDAKRFPNGEANDEMRRLLARKHRGHPPVLVMTLDDPALTFALDSRNGAPPRTPIVFCGVNDLTTETLEGQSQVTGLIEDLDYAKTLDTILRLHPDTREIAVVSDVTATGLATRRRIEALAPRYATQLAFRYLGDAPMSDLLAQLERLEPDCVVLLGAFSVDRAGAMFAVESSTELFARYSPVPVYGLHELRLGHGIVGGFLLGGRPHGERAAELALRVLGGEDIADIPIESSSAARPMFDFRQLARFGIRAAQLPEGSTVINRPESLYHRHRALVLGMTAALIGLSAIVCLLTVNILRRRRAERALSRERELLARILETSPVGVTVVNAEGRITFANQRAEEIHGLSKDEITSRVYNAPEWHITDYDGNPLPEDELPFQRAKATGRLVREARHAIQWPDGRRALLVINATPLLDEAGRFEGVVASVRDATESVRAEQALRESEEQYRRLFEDSPVALWEADFSAVKQRVEALRATGVTDFEAYLRQHPEEVGYCVSLARVVRANRACIDLYQARDEQEFRERFGSLVGKEMPETSRKVLLAIISGLSSLETDHVIRTLRGERRYARGQWRVVPGCEETLARTLIIALDMTRVRQAEEERRALEEQVRLTQKLESLGVLAGGIAHDFNNLLVGILGNADLALEQLSPLSPATGYLRGIERAAQRAADLCRQMLAYSGKGRFVIERLDFSRTVNEMKSLLESSVSKKATLRYTLAEGLPAVEADAAQIRQVIMNLVTNASEALGDNDGVVTIVTGAKDYSHEYLSETYLNEQLPAGRYVQLAVEDTGCGMDQATQARVFDPFFTTKFTGRGLGLAAVLGIVRGHRGAIKIYSEPGKGTTVKALFPACEQPASTPQAESVDTGPWRGSGSVLIADDEQAVRAVGQRVLEQLGFQVLTASDGREAIDIAQRHAGAIVCVLLDLTMPQLDGEETFRELRRLQPGIPVILSSGYSEQEAVSRFAGKGLAGFIQKPYHAAELAQAVRKAMAEKGATR